MRLREIGRQPPLVVTALGLILLQNPLAFAQSSGFSITPVVKRGDPITDGGRFFPSEDSEGRVVGLNALNSRGDVAIDADTSGSCSVGRFLISGGESIRLADFCRQTPWGKMGLLGPVNINNHGQAAYLAGPVNGDRILSTLFLYSDGEISRIIGEGDATPVGSVFNGCGFSQPSINNSGDVAFSACIQPFGGPIGDGVFVYSGGVILKVLTDGDPFPTGGELVVNFIPPVDTFINDRGDMLFFAGLIVSPAIKERYGLFLSTEEGLKTVVLDGDPMPTGGIVMRETLTYGALNNKRDVAFLAILQDGPTKSGIFISSNGQVTKVIAEGDQTPLGGVFASQGRRLASLVRPRFNNNSAVAFYAPITNGAAPWAIFLASPRAMVKVVAIGDHLPTGGKIRDINSFALNDLGQVAFFAAVKNGPQGVFLATPLAPEITKVKVKRKGGSLELRVDGSAMITNDTVIEINGVALTDLKYPSAFQEDGGTITRVISRDARIEQLVPLGQTVEVSVFNSLTNLRSAARSFTR
ncbi:MAG TPA: choice-of-anchor tandem repeat NxxGxxAF-containing protein [Blastocatellia bacterium]|nr:choice-of-anchor tandem repeat NxxGxxAF-containing protein [Blastocatellia bacterium]